MQRIELAGGAQRPPYFIETICEFIHEVFVVILGWPGNINRQMQ